MTKTIKKLIIPCAENNYTPALITKKALSVYIIALVIFNLVAADLNFDQAQAQVTSQSLYELHNRERETNNLKPLSVNTSLIDSAEAKAQVMLENNCWSHFCPEGTSPWIFFDDAGYNYIYAGENLAEGFTTNESVITAWLNSPTHRANMLNPNFTEIGIGFAEGDFQGIENNTIIVVHFGSRSQNTGSGLNQLPETGQNSQVSIDSPKDGEFLRDNQPEISGKTTFNSEVSIEVDGSEMGRIKAEGSNFTYRPTTPFTEGPHDLQAVAYNNNFEQSRSETVGITIDTIAPGIELDTLTVNSVSIAEDGSADVYLSVAISESPTGMKVTTNIEPTKVSYLEGYDWELAVDKEQLLNSAILQITATDKAGNTARESTSVENLSGRVLSLVGNTPVTEVSDSNTNFLGSFGELFDSKDVKTQVNIGFMGVLSFVFLLDFYILAKSGMTATVRGKPHLHFGALIIILLIAVIGGLSGDILVGITS